MPHAHRILKEREDQTPPALSKPQLHILQHALGLDDYGRGDRYRNAFVTGPEGKDGNHCSALVAMGYMHDHGPRAITSGMHCYTVTEAGDAQVIAQSPQPPKLTRAQRRYRYWRKIRDVFPDTTFLDFLTLPEFADYRQRALA